MLWDFFLTAAHTATHIHTYHNQIIILLSPQETWKDALKEKQEWKNKNKRQKQNKLHWKHSYTNLYPEDVTADALLINLKL